MINKIIRLKGILYRNQTIYKLLDRIKLRKDSELRFKIANTYIDIGSSVLDVCSASGELKDFLFEDVDYHTMECSLEFTSVLNKKGIKNFEINLHTTDINNQNLKVDVVVMIISLYQFRDTTMHNLLEVFKSIAKKVVIVEEVLEKRRSQLKDNIMNYLSATDYYLSTKLFTINEFEQIMEKHDYSCINHGERYIVGYYHNAKN